MIQLILHLWGDYILQSQWMADNKTKRWFPALVHATVYSLPFFLIGSWQAVLVIWSTHAVIDRYRFARYVCWAKNFIAFPKFEKITLWRFIDPSVGPATVEWDEWRWVWPKQESWKQCFATGYPATTPDYLATWLLIIADNTLHLTINAAALAYL